MTKAKILIVEDEAVEALDIEQHLVSLGYSDPDIAGSGEEGIRKAEETHPDLVLMDIMLPGKFDGIAAAEQIRSRFKIPIIYLTAYADENTLHRAKITQPYGYIIKPFQERELHIAIEIALHKHEMERKLRESQEWFSTTLRSIGDAVMATDQNGLVIFMNRIAEDLTGWMREEAVNRKLIEVCRIINRDTRRPVDNPVDKVLRTGNIIGLANHSVLIARDGGEIPIDDSAAPIKDDKGHLRGVVFVFRDITERNKAEEALKRTNDELEIRVLERTRELTKANELLASEQDEIRKLNQGLEQRVAERTADLEAANKEMEAFSYSVSHDLRAPLRSIDGFSKALLEDYGNKLDDTAKDYLNRVCGGAQKMGDLIDAMLSLSRLTRNELVRRKVSLTAIATEIAGELKKAEPERQVEFVIGESVVARADQAMLRAVLDNLLRNAWKFTAKHEKARIEFGVQMSPKETIYYVRDDGAGFNMDYANKLFNAFQRLHRASDFPGIGIGLATVQRIVHRHGGRIWAEGEVEKGATFYFTLGKRKE